LIVITLLCFLLCGCNAKGPADASTIPLTTQENSPSEEISTVPEQETLDSYPLVFVDATTEDCEAIVMGYVSHGTILETERFLYGEETPWDYLESSPAVSSDILPAGTNLKFTSNYGAAFEANSKELHATVDMLNLLVHVTADLDTPASNPGYYLGAPGNVSLHPQKIVRNGTSITVDLDADEQMDTISWEFAEYSESSDIYYNYAITVTTGAQSYTLSSAEDECLLDKEDIAIFPVDLEQDGIYELAVFSKSFGRFRNISIYKLSENDISELFCHIIDGMP